MLYDLQWWNAGSYGTRSIDHAHQSWNCFQIWHIFVFSPFSKIFQLIFFVTGNALCSSEMECRSDQQLWNAESYETRPTDQVHQSWNCLQIWHIFVFSPFSKTFPLIIVIFFCYRECIALQRWNAEHFNSKSWGMRPGVQVHKSKF